MTTQLVVDAGVLAAALAHPGTFGTNARAALRGHTWHVPAHAAVEALSVLRKWDRDGTLTPGKADASLETFALLPGVTVHDQAGLTPRTWELRHSVAPYDAVYAALAEQLGCAVVTIDGRLANAPGPKCPFIVVARN